MTQIHLDGVALQQHDEPYPFDYRPYAHQIELSRLVRGESGFVAVNDSPTGGGKTSSWLAPALAEGIDTIAIYPTNALVEDQTRQVLDETDSVDHEVAVMTVTSDRLSEKRSEYNAQSNIDAVERWYRENRTAGQIILLTNPDIFVMFCRDLYSNPARAYKRFPLVVVDEFHRAGRKEQNTLRYLLDELYERDDDQRWLRKVAFLSATPDEREEHQFEHAMAAPYYRVTKSGTNERQAFTDSLAEGWKEVMPPVELDVRVAPTFGTADILLRDDFDDLLGFCRNSTGDGATDRVAIILDGVHEVKRVYDQLERELDRRVERIDGFHSEDKAKKLDNFEVLVSNSAVEVGIDFDIDGLVFAGHDRSSFLQRLGRLRNKQKICPAICYVPRDVGRDLEAYDGSSLTRRELDDVLDTVYSEPRKPRSFGWRYSALEALEHLDTRLRGAPSESVENITRQSQLRIRRHFLDGTGVRLDDDDLHRMKEAIDWRVLTDMRWYRGDSIQALVYDHTEQSLRTYRLFHLLRWGDVEFHTERDFRRIVPDEHHSSIDRSERYVDGFCTYNGTITPSEDGYGRSVAFKGPRLASWIREKRVDSARTPSVLPGVKVKVTPNGTGEPLPTVDLVNDRLSSRRDRAPGKDGGLLCYPVSGSSSLVKQRFDLGDFFFLYPVSVGTDTNYSLAIGTDALYLHCHVMEEAEAGPDDDQDDEEFIGL